MGRTDLDRRTALTGLGLAGAALWASSARAGSLNPPAGAVSPTMKPLDEVEPRIPINNTTAPPSSLYHHVISEPGSYYLTEQLSTPPVPLGAILVNAPDVIVDLNGFTITRSGDLTGILVPTFVRAAQPRVTFRNGRIHRNPDPGDHPAMSFTESATLENITFSGRFSRCVIVDPALDCVIRDCDFLDGPVTTAIDGGSRLVVERCRFRSVNTAILLINPDSTVVRGCTVEGGAIGISVANAVRTSVLDNVVAGCAGTGFDSSAATNAFLRNVAIGNGANYSAGIQPVAANPAAAGPWDNISLA